jgi:excisionase family DNA binding protein
MPDDFASLLTVTQLAALLGCHRETVLTWISPGLIPRGGGERVRLRTCKVGNLTKTTRQWHAEFQAALAPAFTPAATQTALQRQAAADTAKLRERLNKNKRPARKQGRATRGRAGPGGGRRLDRPCRACRDRPLPGPDAGIKMISQSIMLDMFRISF